MKTLITILTGTLSIMYNINCRAQTWDEWFNQKKTQEKYLVQQIAALQVYLEYLKKGYEIAQDGLTLIGDIKDGNFSLHKNYFESLGNVNPLIRNSSKAAHILLLSNLIIKEIEAQHESCRNDENFSKDEIIYLSAVYANLKKECRASVSELTGILTDRELRMQDDQRLANVDRIHAHMKDLYAFLGSFDPRILALQRDKERAGIEIMRKLNDWEP